MDLDFSARDLRTGKTVVTTLDVHAAGEPLRIITAGLPPLQGRTMLERRRWMHENLDDVRRALMLEPRGHADMYGCVVTPPVTPQADLGFLYGVIFTGPPADVTRAGPHEAVVPEVSGSAHLTGRHEFLLDPADPLGGGFLIGRGSHAVSDA